MLCLDQRLLDYLCEEAGGYDQAHADYIKAMELYKFPSIGRP
jgi:hypothetical protein